MQTQDAFFFIGIFVFVFVLWIVLGGPNRPLALSGPTLAAPDRIGGGTYLTFPRADVKTSKPSSTRTSSTGSRTTTTKPASGTTLSAKDQRAVDAAIKAAAFGVPSSYRGQVTLSRVSSAGNANPQNEYIQLSVSRNAKGPIAISGWSIVSEVTGKGGSIPKGTEVPRSGVINAAEPIVLQPGDRAYLVSGRSPIGASFRENVCIGYFGQFQKFTPSLPNSCPTPETELEKYYGPGLVQDPYCAEYVEDLNRCTLVLTTPPHLSSRCLFFVSTYLNYNGCVATHERDANFKRNTWRVYLGHTVPIWRKDREVIKLYDDTGKTVYMLSY